jgi:hypothetical protein
MCERRTAMESSRAELIVPRGAQLAGHCGKKVGKKRTTVDNDALRHAEAAERSVVNARDPNDGLRFSSSSAAEQRKFF